MRTYRTQGGPFREAYFLSPDEIENACCDALKVAACLPTTPTAIDIETFAEKSWGLDYQDLGDGVLGCTMFGRKGVQKIIIAPSLAEGCEKAIERRLRSTIAHECGHALFHTSLFVTAMMEQQQTAFGDWANRAAPRVLCREADIFPDGQRKYDRRWWEVQANMAIGPLLMPQKLAIAALLPMMEERGKMGTRQLREGSRDQAARHLADVFNVNPAVARIRIEVLCPLTEGQLLL